MRSPLPGRRRPGETPDPAPQGLRSRKDGGTRHTRRVRRATRRAWQPVVTRSVGWDQRRLVHRRIEHMPQARRPSVRRAGCVHRRARPAAVLDRSYKRRHSEAGRGCRTGPFRLAGAGRGKPRLVVCRGASTGRTMAPARSRSRCPAPSVLVHRDGAPGVRTARTAESACVHGRCLGACGLRRRHGPIRKPRQRSGAPAGPRRQARSTRRCCGQIPGTGRCPAHPAKAQPFPMPHRSRTTGSVAVPRARSVHTRCGRKRIPRGLSPRTNRRGNRATSRRTRATRGKGAMAVATCPVPAVASTGRRRDPCQAGRGVQAS